MAKKRIFGLDPKKLDKILSIGTEDADGSDIEDKKSHTEEDTPANKFDAPNATASLGMFAEQPGGQIGRYKLLSILGEGGMGIVYLAEQKRTIRRQVALKVIKPGMDSKRVIARFEAERQALALLDHPNIAHVHDAGTTENGRPYFVMEYVKGLSITEYCDHHKLTIEDRLNLFRQVCLAVHHAHQKGIIHRDIKPSNILVSLQDDQAIPKIIDLGVAKALAQPLTERTLTTEDSQLLGTPEYMSPEQADMAIVDIDTRSDIYSLGVLLYVLLTGVLPFDYTTFRKGGIEHIRQVIRETDPKTPSTRLTNLGEEAKKVAESRRTEIATLAKKLHKELEWIPLKAMRKERVERYRSASELADDIENYLKGAPLIAGPPSTVYRLKKFVRRNRALVTGIAAVMAILIVGIVVSTVLAIGQAKARAEAQAVSDFLRHSVLESLDSYRVGGRQITIRSVLDAASKSLNDEKKLEHWPLAEADIRATLGFAYWSLGLYEQAASHDERALEIRRAHLSKEDTLLQSIMETLGWVYFDQCRFKEAEKLFVEAVEANLGVEDEDNWWDAPISMNMLASLYIVQGRFREANEYCLKAMEIVRSHLGEPLVSNIHTLACCYYLQGRYKEAEEQFRKALEIGQRDLGKTDWHTLSMMRDFSELCCDLGRYDEAEQLLTNVMNFGRSSWDDEHPERLKIMASLGWLYYNQGQYEQAEDVLRSALKTAQQVLGDEHTTTANCMHRLGTVYLKQGQYDQAEPLLTNAWDVLCRLLSNDNWASLTVKNTLCKLYMARGHFAKAESLLIEALEISRRTLGDDHPLTLTTVNNLAIVNKEQAKYKDAEDLLIEAVEGRIQKLGKQHPDTIESMKDIIELYEAWSKPQQAAQWRAKLPKGLNTTK